MHTEKRVAIVGTAPSWKQAPFADPSIEIWGLNDGYACRDAQGRGLPRADRWFELHPLNHMYFRDLHQRVIYDKDVPKGFYVRPKGHLEWLADQSKRIPVYLQGHPPLGFGPNAQRFPIESVEAEFGSYWAAGPSYEIALAILEGFTEIQVWGIHLSTEQEYIDQRPNFEHLLGIARGRGIKVVMAEQSPVLKHGWKYAYEPRPQKPVDPILVQIRQIKERRATVTAQLMKAPTAATRDLLRRIDAQETDLRMQLARKQQGSTALLVPVRAA